MQTPPPERTDPETAAEGDGAAEAGPKSAAYAAMEIASRHGQTPCYVYDAAVAEARADELHGLLGTGRNGGDSLFYSFKANPNPELASVLRGRGCRAELTSPGELEAAREAGFAMGEALYGGPGKGREEFAEALAAGVRCFSVESLHDLESLASACAGSGARAEAILRVNPEDAPRARVAMSGVASQFGFEEGDLLRLSPELGRLSGSVALAGFHIYWGTQIGSADALVSSFASALKTMEKLAEALGIAPRVLNLGGGFPWPYARTGGGEDLSSMRGEIEALRTEAKRSPWIGNAAWWFESGRYLSAASGFLVAKVMEVKESKEGRQFLILDTGIHHLGGMAGLGRIPRFQIDLVPPPRCEGEERFDVDVVGPLCTPLDCIGRRVAVPKSLGRGDLVAIPNVGAYGVTASVVAFLSRQAPLELLCRDGEVVATNRLRGGHAAEGAPAAGPQRFLGGTV